MADAAADMPRGHAAEHAAPAPPSPRHGPVKTQASKAWNELFWIAVEDPSGEEIYVCPSSGETRWQLEAGAFLLPRDVHGEYWELLDERRGTPYWYNTASKTSTCVALTSARLTAQLGPAHGGPHHPAHRGAALAGGEEALAARPLHRRPARIPRGLADAVADRHGLAHDV